MVGALFVPVVLVGSSAQAKIISSQDNLEKDALETSAKVVYQKRFMNYDNTFKLYIYILFTCILYPSYHLLISLLLRQSLIFELLLDLAVKSHLSSGMLPL